MIPKIIHYCWFGRNPMPEKEKECIASWGKFLPDYEVIRWDEDNFDVRSNRFAAEAYAEKKYAFVADYVRLYVLFHHGGIYMDADVEVVRPLDRFLSHKAFSGFEDEMIVPTGIIACTKDFGIVGDLLGYYNTRGFRLDDGSCDTKSNTKIMTEFFLKRGLCRNNTLQNIDGMVFYPNDFFCPKNYATREIFRTENTYTIHHFSGSWFPERRRKRLEKKEKRLQQREFLQKRLRALWSFLTR